MIRGNDRFEQPKRCNRKTVTLLHGGKHITCGLTFFQYGENIFKYIHLTVRQL